MTDDMKLTTDPLAELAAMTEIAKALQLLDPESIRRVLQWAADRFGASVKSAPPPITGSATVSNENKPELQAQTEGVSPTYPNIADLYTAANPKGDSEKALVVAYWVQTNTNQSDFDAATINKELKHLGFGVGNITTALGSLSTRKPTLVIQTRKSGSSQQARKRYRLTTEGIKYVCRMVQAEG